MAILARRFLLAAAVLLSAQAVGAQGSRFKEAEVKAVFLLNFAKFVEWPPEAFAGPQAPIVIGVLGADPFGEILDRTIAAESVNGRPVAVKRFESIADLEPCHVLYISSSEKARLPEILAQLETAKVLTVGDMKRFARRGGAINFVSEQNKIRFEINKKAADRAGLKISSQLLKLARMVRTE